MDGQDADIICSEAPNRESTAQRSNPTVRSFEHSVSPEGFFLLPSRFNLKCGNPILEVFVVYRLPSRAAELELLLELNMLVGEPLSDLFPAEGDLTRAISDIEDWVGMFRRRLSRDG